MQRSLIRHRFERIGLVVGILLAAIVIVAVISMVLRSDQGPLEPTPESTEQPTIGPTKIATPATPGITFDPAPPPEPGSLLHMLGYAPDRLQDDSLPLSDIARYANIERWMKSQGIETPTSPDDPAWEPWRAELSSLALPEVLATRGTDDIWMQTYGFGLHDIDQVLAVGSAPDYVMVLRGDFDSNAIHTAWADSGYQAVRVDDVTYWSLYPGGSVDLSAPASRPALGNMNNIVLLDDGTIIATARSGRLEQTIRTVNGTNPALADNADMQTLLAPGTAPESLLTAVLLKGNVLEESSITPTVPIVATPTPSLPQAKMLLVGLQLPTDAANRPTMVIVAVYDSADSATMAQQRAQKQLQAGTSAVTERAYADRATLLSIRVISASNGDRLLLVQLTLVHGSDDWLQIVEERDFGYLMWPRIP